MCPELPLVVPLSILLDGCLMLTIFYNHDPQWTALLSHNVTCLVHADTGKIAMPVFGRRDLMAPSALPSNHTTITIANELSPRSLAVKLTLRLYASRRAQKRLLECTIVGSLSGSPLSGIEFGSRIS